MYFVSIIPSAFTFAGAIARTFSFFGSGTGPIYLDNVGCRGTESRITDCPSFGLNNHNCGHQEDAGVTCQSKRPYYCGHIVACTISKYGGCIDEGFQRIL